MAEPNRQSLHRRAENTPKYIASTTLKEPLVWRNSTLLQGDAADAVARLDGPYTEGKEHVGGLMIVKAPDLDVALEWGRRLARVITLPIEVRPFQGEAER